MKSIDFLLKCQNHNFRRKVIYNKELAYRCAVLQFDVYKVWKCDDLVYHSEKNYSDRLMNKVKRYMEKVHSN